MSTSILAAHDGARVARTRPHRAGLARHAPTPKHLTGVTTHRPWFVAAPIAAESGPAGDLHGRSTCDRCGADVFIEAAAAELVQATAAVACWSCTGTSEGILFIPPVDWGIAA